LFFFFFAWREGLTFGLSLLSRDSGLPLKAKAKTLGKMKPLFALSRLREKMGKGFCFLDTGGGGFIYLLFFFFVERGANIRTFTA